MQKKKSIEEKKKSITIKIDSELFELLNDFIEEKNIKNKSKFIEELIIRELSNIV